MSLRLQKHERLCVDAIVSVATAAGLKTNIIRRGKHSTKVVIKGENTRRTIAVPSSPHDPDWAVVVAQKQAAMACSKIKGPANDE